MHDIEFTWDKSKSRINLKKHGISFEEAKTVFLDENARVIYDPDHSINDDRFVILGISARLRILVVCHCYKEGESIIRIISARKANKKEQNQYRRP